MARGVNTGSRASRKNAPRAICWVGPSSDHATTLTPAEWQAAIEAGKVFIGRDGKPLKTDALRKAIKRATGSLLAADVIDIDNEMVTIRSGPGGEEMSFGTAEEDFADEDE